MNSATIKTTDEVISCSDNGQHPLVYINLKGGTSKCQYCGQNYKRVAAESNTAS